MITELEIYEWSHGRQITGVYTGMNNHQGFVRLVSANDEEATLHPLTFSQFFEIYPNVDGTIARLNTEHASKAQNHMESGAQQQAEIAELERLEKKYR